MAPRKRAAKAEDDASSKPTKRPKKDTPASEAPLSASPEQQPPAVPVERGASDEPKADNDANGAHAAVEEDEYQDEYEGQPQEVVQPQRASDLYLDTVNRAALDFDFEKVCSVSLSNINIYGCLVCGKYFQGRSKLTPAFAHSIHDDHHVFMHLETSQVSALSLLLVYLSLASRVLRALTLLGIRSTRRIQSLRPLTRRYFTRPLSKIHTRHHRRTCRGTHGIRPFQHPIYAWICRPQ